MIYRHALFCYCGGRRGNGPSKPQASATKTSGNSGWVAVPGNTPKALSETISLDGHADLLPTNGDSENSKDLYVFLKDAADNVSNASNKLAVIVDATAWIGVVAPAASFPGLEYVISEGNTTAGNVMLELNKGYEYRLAQPIGKIG